MGVFLEALKEFTDPLKIWTEPEVFTNYCEKFHLKNPGTQLSISVQDFPGLDKDLRLGNVMVLRLGTKDRQAKFALIRAKSNLRTEFFCRATFETEHLAS